MRCHTHRNTQEPYYRKHYYMNEYTLTKLYHKINVYVGIKYNNIKLLYENIEKSFIKIYFEKFSL